MEDTPQRTYNILVYGIEKVGLEAPDQDIITRNYRLTFERFHTEKSFNDFDGVIIFQGIFEQFEQAPRYFGSMGTRKYRHPFARDELDKRKKQMSLLLNKDGFACFLLVEQFFDRNNGDRISDTGEV